MKLFLYLTIGLAGVIGGFAAVRFGRLTDAVENPIEAIYRSLSPTAQALYLKQSENLTKPVPERLVALDEKTIDCFGPQQVLVMSSSDTNLGGQCCGPLMDIGSYDLQLQALRAFIAENDGNALIPRDPYDIPVPHAQTLIRLERDIVLMDGQQKIYDAAIPMSHHGGPCCCKCWKYAAMSGLAKELIADRGWNAHQIAELWDLSSSCGHKEDTNMRRHYTPQRNDDG